MSEERERRVEALLKATLDRKRIRADRLFVWLFIAQWAFAILLACVLSPFSWQGSIRTVHPHVELAIFGGLVLNALPCALIVLRPGRRSTRTTVAVAQMLWSSLLIHLTGGRIETHFHVFVSLVCIAFYADWRLLIPATFTVAVDHFVRGEFWPESVYGTATPEWWRFLEHAAWVMFEDFILILSCRRAIADARAVADREISLNEAAVRETELKIAERSTEIRANALHATTEQYRALLEATAAVPWEFDPASRRCVFIGRQVERLWGWPHERFDQEDFLLHCVHHGDRQRVMAAFDKSATSEESSIEYLLRRADGSFANVRTLFTRAEVEDGSHVVRGVTIDVTAQRKLEIELRQAQKLESVGRLAAGIAHEINTPIQFVSDSVHFVRDASQDLLKLVDAYEDLRRSVVANEDARPAAELLAKTREDADFDYVRENVPAALDRSLDGLRRVAVIVRSMKDFSHQDEAEMAQADLAKAIESTLVIARHEFKYVADVVTEFEPLPPVTCHVGEINQALLNIVVNAAHAVGDVVKGTGGKGLIKVTARRDGDDALVTVSDTGGGIPEKIRDRIFDPFFTTKEVGKGTGQGLAIARASIEAKHGGSLTLESVMGRGTTFFIRIPIERRVAEPAGERS